MLTTAQHAESHARRVMQRDHASRSLGDAGGMDAVFKLLSAHRESKPPAEEVARQPAHTQLECIGERVKPAAAAQGETDEEKLERVRKALSDAFVFKGERVELMGDFDAFVAAVKAEAALKEFPKNTGKSCATTGRSWSGEGQRKCRKRMASRYSSTALLYHIYSFSSLRSPQARTARRSLCSRFLIERAQLH